MTVVERLGLIRDRVLDWWRSAAVVQWRREVRHLIVDLAIPTTRRLFVEGALPRSRHALAIAGARGSQMLEQRAPRIVASLRRIPPRLRVPVVAALVVAILIGAVVAFSRPAPDITAATAFLDGEYIAPPFDVKEQNGDIFVNGKLVRRKSVIESPAPVPTNPKDLGDLAAIASARIAGPGVTSAEVDAVVALLRSFPVTASVERQEDVVVITDRAGASTEVIYNGRAEPTAENIAQSQQSLARFWRGVLDKGGVLLTADNVDVTVPADDAPTFLAAIADALSLPEADRRLALGRITGSLEVAEAILRTGSATKLRERVAMWPGPMRAQAAARYGLMAPAANAIDDAETPRSHMAFLFDYFQSHWELDVVRPAIQHAGYTLVQYQTTERVTDLAKAHFARAFASIELLGGAGLLYMATHGVKDGILLEGFKDRQQAEARMREYLALGEFLPGDLRLDKWSADLWLTKAGIARHFKDHNTIVQLSICYGFRLADAFHAREFIGPGRSTTDVEAMVIDEGLYSRLEGIKEEGAARLFGVAAPHAIDEYAGTKIGDIRPRPYGEGPFNYLQQDQWLNKSEWHYQGNGKTVLAPGVADVQPRTGIAPKKQVRGLVRFDVPMDTEVSPLSILEVRGCDSHVVPRSVRWDDARTLSFAVETAGEGTLVLTAISAAARSAGAGIPLLRNTDPSGQGSGPDFSWNVPCEPGALGQRPDGQQTRLGQFSASAEKARVGDKVTLTVAVSSGDQWLCGGEFHTPGGVRFVTISGVPGAKLLDWSPRQLSRPGARVEGPPQSGAITWRAGEANPEPPNCRELSAQGGAPTGLFKTGDVFTATYEVTAPTSDWVLLRASIQNEQGTGGAAVAFAATGQASPTPTPTTAPTPSRPVTTPPSDPSVLVRSCSPSTVTPERARPLVGRDVTLCFPVWKVETTGIGSVILWSSDSPPRVAAIIPKSATTRFAERFGPASGLRGLLIETSGRLLLHDDVPQVVLLSSNQLSLPLADR